MICLKKGGGLKPGMIRAYKEQPKQYKISNYPTLRKTLRVRDILIPTVHYFTNFKNEYNQTFCQKKEVSVWSGLWFGGKDIVFSTDQLDGHGELLELLFNKRDIQEIRKNVIAPTISIIGIILLYNKITQPRIIEEQMLHVDNNYTLMAMSHINFLQIGTMSADKDMLRQICQQILLREPEYYVKNI